MARLLVDERDIKFVLFELLKVQELCQQDRFSNWKEGAFVLLLEEARKFAEKRLFPLNLEGDRIGVRFDAGEVFAVPGTKDSYRDFVDAGWLTPCEEEAYGGQGLPEVIKFAAHEIFFAANFPFMCYVNLTHDAAKLIEKFGTSEQKRLYLDKMYGGQWTGTMALTESSAGSDVGAIEVKATKNGDGTYHLTGQKIFITNGDHDIAENIVHMVLARIDGDLPGTKGLSIFIVPKYRLNEDGSIGQPNDVRCIGVEHKMGLSASPTTTMSFGEQGDCTAYLLGRERDGIKIMFHMMNASRLEVGMWGQGICSASYLHALNYSRERKQGASLKDPGSSSQVPIIRHPDVRRLLLLMKSHIEGMRAMLYFCGYAMDRSAIAETAEEKTWWRNIVELLIPICKAYPTEKGVEFASHAIQIHGGFGYTRECPVEQFMRDSKAACIFEGTTGVQAIDFAVRKVAMDQGRVFQDFLSGMDKIVCQSSGWPGWEKYLTHFHKTKTALQELPAHLAEQSTRAGNFYSLLKATPFLDAAGDVFVSYFLLWSALAASEKLESLLSKEGLQDKDKDNEQRKEFIRRKPQAAYLAGKIESAKYFIGNVLPVTDGKIAAIRWGDSSAWEMEETFF